LSGALSAAGATPVQACEYTFPVTDASSFLAVAQILEGVGVSACLFSQNWWTASHHSSDIGAARYIANPDYLQVAAYVLALLAVLSSYSEQ
jgi:hypothetical protein